MAGGRGERLWPLVRSGVPKVCLSPDGRQTLLEATLHRVRPLTRASNTLIVTIQPQAGPIRRILPQRFRRSLLVEPEPKNTAACLALAAAVLARHDPDQIMVALPADHWIAQSEAFYRSLQAAIETARKTGRIALIGLRPTRVHPGLGHLCLGAKPIVRQGCRVFRLVRFVEKPPVSLARRLVQRHQAYWNAGVFIGRVATFLALIERWLPDHARVVFPLGKTARAPDFAKRAAAAYRTLRAVSFDHGVMAHLRDGEVVEGQFDWEDLGSWDSWVRVSRHRRAPPITIGGCNVNAISTNGHLVATVGLNDAIVVQTPDATLICHADAAQGVRDVVARLSRDARLSRYL
ncbi:MAG: mannose-1-phosphate guanylyltransferase [Candidatus Omnitrophica bacterium]|nr:mannose-1-phosphate guanylyltransferase [Candidatus Omnitrophota bacterium]